MRIRQEDTVQVIAGKDKGRRGKVQRVMRREGLLFVEGLNVVKRHIRPRPNIRQAGIVQMEAPLQMSKVMLVCGHCDKAVRVSKRFLEDGKKVRVCKTCQEVID